MENVARRNMRIICWGPCGRGVTVVALVRGDKMPGRLAGSPAAVVAGNASRTSPHLAMVKVNYIPTGGDVAVFANV